MSDTNQRCDRCDRLFRDTGGSTTTLAGEHICRQCADHAETEAENGSRAVEQEGLDEFATDGGQAFHSGDSHVLYEDPAPDPDPAHACIECGKEALDRCGCCGAPLCGRHNEVQGGFCSNFTSIGDVPLCVVWPEAESPDVVVYHWALARDTIDVLVAPPIPDADAFHIPDPEDVTVPICDLDDDLRPVEAPLSQAHDTDLELCGDCEDQAVAIVQERESE